MSLAMYDRALSAPSGLWVEHADGRQEPLPLDRWRGGLDRADRALLARVAGSALDVGCGPGRLTAALAGRGVRALGLDVAPAAVHLTRRRGGRALRCDVFDSVPGAGGWRHGLLADGNIGIGGDPVRLLARTASLLQRGGQVHAEIEPPGRPSAAERLRLRGADGRVGAWFDWARLGVDDVPATAHRAGLEVRETWSVEGRWFVALAGPSRRPAPGP